MKTFGEKKKIDYEFSQMMQEASLLYQEQCLKEHDIDREFIYEKIRDRKRQRVNRFLTSAAAVVLILVTGITVNVWFQADGAYGGKQFIKRCVTIISPLDYDEKIDEDGQKTTIISIDEEKHLDDAEEYFDGLKAARYIPKGYSFKQLTIQENPTSSFVEYVYNHDTDVALVIAFFYSDDSEDEDTVVMGELYLSPTSGKELYISENTATNEYCVIELTENYDCIVSGKGELKEGIRIIESIEVL